MLLVGSVLATCTPADPTPERGLSGTANPLPRALWVDVTYEVLDSTAEWSNKVELADLDGDGWLDILFANGAFDGVAAFGRKQSPRAVGTVSERRPLEMVLRLGLDRMSEEQQLRFAE